MQIIVYSLVSSLILPHLCTDVVVLGIITLVCTDVMVQGYYLFIFRSGIDCNIPSQRCGRLYFPMFLFTVGLFTLMYMASFTALAILWSSLPIILKVFHRCYVASGCFGVHVLEMVLLGVPCTFPQKF